MEITSIERLGNGWRWTATFTDEDQDQDSDVEYEYRTDEDGEGLWSRPPGGDGSWRQGQGHLQFDLRGARSETAARGAIARYWARRRATYGV